MCGRYAIFTKSGILTEIFDLSNAVEFEANYNAAPSHTLPIVIKDRIGLAKWGFVPPFADEEYDGPTPINARAETVADKPMFRESFYKRRCLIPANGYYEWLNTSQGGKIPYFISTPDKDPLAFAGLWSKVNDQVTFCIIVREAIGEIKEIHSRMPVIVPRNDIYRWFSHDPGKWHDILQNKEAYQDLKPIEVSKDVNSVANNDKSLIRSV